MIPSSLAVRSLLLLTLALGPGCDRSGAAGEAPDASAAPPAPRVDRPAFDSAKAFEHLRRQVAFGPRIPGTPGHAAQLRWMKEYLATRADTVIEQPFTHVTRSGETLRMTNLFARFRPDAQDRVLLVAHWDTRPKSDQASGGADRDRPVPGANDGASGVAVLLELADMLKRRPAGIGVDLLLVDGEDYGPTGDDMYLGAKHFAANLPAGYRPFYGILLDMVGDRTPRFPVESNSQRFAPEVVQRVWSLAQELGYGDVFPMSDGGAVEDDHIPLNQAGIRTIDIIDFDYGPGNRYWHTPQDVPENTSAESLRIVGEVIAELVYRGG
ncbi:MAG TPA: M28 family peptidase [Longimicrobiaceae bacterium]|nr:M28 family peptidase [Longimicrobiaceae bacterium]